MREKDPLFAFIFIGNKVNETVGTVAMVGGRLLLSFALPTNEAFKCESMAHDSKRMEVKDV